MSGATVECVACHATESPVLALASSVSPDGWVLHTLSNPTTGASAQLIVCPQCRPLLAHVLKERASASPGS